MNAVCFALEGILSPQETVPELMHLFPQGEKLFEVIRRYNDLLISEKRADYESGDIFSLIIPFLMYHGLKEKDISGLAMKATLTNGSAELITRLSSNNWTIFCISASYRQYALHVTQRLGLFSQNLVCTSFPLDSYYKLLNDRDYKVIEQTVDRIITTGDVDNEWIKTQLDNLFLNELPGTNFKPVLEEVRPVGGQHQAEALKKFADTHHIPLTDWIAVGASITDTEMLQVVSQSGGTAIAFNASEEVLHSATLGLASTYLSDLLPVFEIAEKGDKSRMEKFIQSKEKSGGTGDRNHLRWLASDTDISLALEVHTRIRNLVAEEASQSK
jgi:predicted HAD superfamily phosphohydrolase